MACSTPDCTNEKLLARGLCAACYHRLRKNGSVQRRYVVNTGRCSIEGCSNSSFAKNLCQAHYNQAQGPMYNTWRLLRARNPGAYPPGWDRFETFFMEIGERPTPKHQLRRVDGTRPWGPSNVRWVSPAGMKPSCYTPAEQSAYCREWNLRKRFGINGQEFARLLEAQGGVCALCGGAETHVYKSGKLKDLAVDHDHESGAVRGLLCSNCNQGIGRLQDSPALLRAAADYIEGHAAAGQSANAQRAIVCDAPSAET